MELHRREILRLGALSVFGAGLAPLASASPKARKTGRCIFLFLQGGPSHIDLWDPKPKAPAEVRGPFQTIATALPGVRFGELIPGHAAIADRIAILRSMTHAFNNHIAGTYITLTGSTNQPNADREARGEDFPGPGAVLNYLERTPTGVPASVSLPTWLSIPGPSNRMPGQYGGLLGTACDPFLIAGEPHKPDFRPLSLTLPGDLAPDRVRGRDDLRQQLDSAARRLEVRGAVAHDRLNQAALQLVTDPRVREAVDLGREPDRVRDRYGRTKVGQSLLLARRLLDAGVRFVACNEFNQEWDTHGDLTQRYKNIVPPMDRAYSALVEDLAARGLLDETLVVNVGEFGRTPAINKGAGRDHWPNVYSAILAGGGVHGGLVYGSSDSQGREVADLPVTPADLLATLWTCLGVDTATELQDRQNRPFTLCSGRVPSGLLG